MPEEDYQLRFRTVGNEEAEILAKKVEDATAKIKLLTEAMDRNPRIAQNYAKALQGLHQEAMTASVLLAKFGTVTDTTYQTLERAKVRMESARGESAKFQQGLQKLGYAADDLQYVFQNGMGLRPIINNLMQVSPLVGALALAADLLYRHWDSVEGLWGNSKAKTEAQLMEELAKKTGLTADETRRLFEWEQKRDTIKAQSQGRTEVDKNRNDRANRAVIEAGYSDMLQGLALTQFAADPRMLKAKTGNERDTVFGTIKAEAEKKLQESLANSALGEQALQGLIQTIVGNPQNFGGKDRAMKVAGSLMEATRSYQDAQKDNDGVVRRAAESKETREKLKAIDDWKVSKMVEGGAAIEKSQANFDREQERFREIERETREKDNAFQAGRFNRLGGNAMLDDVITGRLRMGADPQALIKDVGGMLEPIIGKEAARAAARETVESARGRLMQEANTPRITTSQVMAAASVTDYLQGGVSNKDTAKQSVDLLRQANMNLRNIVGELTRTRRMGQVARAG